MINSVSRAYLRASSQAVPNGLKTVILGSTTQGKKVVVPATADKTAPSGRTTAVVGLQSDYLFSLQNALHNLKKIY